MHGYSPLDLILHDRYKCCSGTHGTVRFATDHVPRDNLYIRPAGPCVTRNSVGWRGVEACARARRPPTGGCCQGKTVDFALFRSIDLIWSLCNVAISFLFFFGLFSFFGACGVVVIILLCRHFFLLVSEMRF